MPKKKDTPLTPKHKKRTPSTDFKPSAKPARPGLSKPKGGKPQITKPERPRPVAPPKPEPTVVEPTGFDTLGLRDVTLQALSELGFEVATPIQTLAIPLLLTGCDLIGLAQTGTGKTAAFGLPLIEKVDPENPATQALVLAPTRELAVQVAKGIYEFARYGHLRVVPVVGGQPIDRQFRALKQGAQIVVGTPGRVLDHLRRGSLHLEGVRFCVLDEADEMMALGFTEDMEAILAELPESRQLAFFSATMPPRVLAITSKFLRDPQRIEIVSKQRTLETTNQTYYEVPPGKKQEALVRVLDMETPGSTIVFCRTRLETAELSEALSFHGYNAEPIHGDMGQADRDRVLRRFREGLADLLIATDVAARGLDIELVTHVINYDVPFDAEQYIHRIGRTGRAGRTGDAITLVYPRERRQLANIERLIGSRIEPARIPTIDDIAAQRRKAFVEALRASLNERDFDSMLPSAGELAEEFDPVEVAAAAIHMLWKERHQSAPPADQEDVFAEFEQPEQGMVRIFVGMGRHEGLRPGDLVGAISNESGLAGKEIGVIEVLEHSAFVEVPASEGTRVIEALSRAKLRNRKVKVELAQPGLRQPTPALSGPPKRGPRGKDKHEDAPPKRKRHERGP
ncbi:MAG: DEAD/DEAH box helicase [Fimbriimonas sp.]|nr:DEAD/DEAH box helicase [Fimbriimonas sp.]